MGQILVVVYSYTGTSRELAKLLCSQQNWSMGEIQDALPRGGVQGLWSCLWDSWLHRTPEIRYTGPQPSRFDKVVLVSPIWAYRLAGPMRSFVISRLGQFRDVAVVSVMGSRGGPGAVEEIARLIGRTPILSTAFTQREVEDGSYAARLQAFGTDLQSAKNQAALVRPAVWSAQSI